MLENNPLDPRKNSSKEDEIASTPSDKGKKTDDGILGDLDFWQNRYSDKKTKYEQISLADAIETVDELTESSTAQYEQTFFDGFDIKPKSVRKKKGVKDEIDSLLEDTQRLISHYDEDIEQKPQTTQKPDEQEDNQAEATEAQPAEPEADSSTSEQMQDKADIELDIHSDDSAEQGLSSGDDDKDNEEEAFNEAAELISSESEEHAIDGANEQSLEDADVDDNLENAQLDDEALTDTPPCDEAVQDKAAEALDEAKDDKDKVQEEVFPDSSACEEDKAEDEKIGLTLISNPAEDEAGEQQDEIKEEEILTRSDKRRRKKEQKRQEKLEQQPQIISEFTDPSQRDIILRGLKASLSHMNTVKTAVNVVFIISVIVTLIPLVLEFLKLDIPSFNPVGTIILTVVNIVLLAVAVCFCSQSFVSGLCGFKRGITAHTLSSITVILALIQAIASIFAAGNSPILNFTYISVAILALLLNVRAEQKNINRIIICFDFCAYTQGDALYSIRNIKSAEDCEIIGKELNMENPKILYSGRIDFPSEFLKGCKSSNISSSIIKRNLALSLVMSFILAGLAGFLNQSSFVILSIFTAAFCLTAPFTVLLTLSSTLLKANESLSLDGGVILSYPSAKSCAEADAAAVDCADLFCRSRCEIRDIKTTGAVRADDVLLYSVAMILQSGGPLSEVFNSIIGGQRDMLPRITRLKYEDNLGLIAKISTHKILLGSKELMMKNNIKMPNVAEEKYIKHGFKLLYMSVDSVFAAFFVLKYQEDKTLNDSINEIQNRGVKLIMRTDDPNVTKDYVADCFKLDKSYVCTTDYEGSYALRWHRNSLVSTAPAGVLHDGNPYSYFRSIVICHRLRKFASSIKNYALLLSLLLCAASTAALMLSSWAVFSPVTIILVHSLALLLISLIEKMRI